MLVARRVSQVENQGLHTNEGVLNSVGTHVKRQSIYRPIVNFLYRYLSIVHLPDSLCIWGIVYGIVFLSVPFLSGEAPVVIVIQTTFRPTLGMDTSLRMDPLGLDGRPT
jgi:hypothetical protein